MKKVIKPLFGLLIATGLIACAGATEQTTEENTEEAAVETVAEPTTVAVNLDESNVMWTGTAIGMYSHFGNISISEGSLEMTGDAISGGNFTIDMASITPTDSGYSEEHSAEMLVGHLSTGDFFLVDSFPTASFVITSADMANGTITGDLTIRGITNEATIENVSVDTEGGEASGDLTFDRQAYEVAYKSTMKDMVISDDIELKISLKM